ncbi:MAG: 2-amino-4-hydroxy-6-hydroxymethyldihydropteridine diphosphokinase [Anaerolineae bacterium]|nr:2-amino-4-hydroxy-6-hydroxymethyldihydropteridine diphosphokinase [Anaerolineae bacterium]
MVLNTAYLSLGSNIEPETNIKSAVELLARHTKLLAVSSVWETKPVGFTKQANFLNAAAIVQTKLPAQQLKERALRKIEKLLGRVRQANKNAPRSIDIDIMLFNRQIFTMGDRHIPDPEILERPFVALPLAEIAPDYVHPETGQTLKEIAESFNVSNEDMFLREDVSRVLAHFVQRSSSIFSHLNPINLERKT